MMYVIYLGVAPDQIAFALLTYRQLMMVSNGVADFDAILGTFHFIIMNMVLLAPSSLS